MDCDIFSFVMLILLPFIFFTAGIINIILNLYIDFTISPKYEKLFRKKEGFFEHKIGNRVFSIIIIIFTVTLIIRPIAKQLLKCLGAEW